MKLPSFSLDRQTTVAISTIAVVALLFAYYFLVHTKTQESRLKKQAFNHLVTLSDGFSASLESHRASIEKLLLGNSDYIFDNYDSLYKKNQIEYWKKRDSLANIFNESKAAPLYEGFEGASRKYYEHLSTRRNIPSNTLEELKERIPKMDAFNLLKIEKYEKESIDEDETIQNESTSGSQIEVNVEVSNHKFNFTSTIFKEDKGIFKLYFSTDLEDFVESSLYNRIFDDFILIADDSIVYQTLDFKFRKINYDTLRKLNREINYLSNIVNGFKNSGRTSDVVTDESLVGKAISSKNFYDINISEIQYKLFLNQFEINGGHWTLCGFINSDEFNQQKRAVEPSFLLIVLTALLFILLASQLIKLFISNKVEQYYIHNLIFSVIAITVGSSIIVISILSSNAYWIEERELKDLELKNLNENIKGAFNTEIEETINYIKFADQYLQKDSVTPFPIIMSRDSFDHVSDAPPFGFDYDNVFWIDENGDEVIRLYQKTKPLSLMNVSQRDYFRKLRDGTGFHLSSSNSEEDMDYYIQPVISYVTGSKIVVTSVAVAEHWLGNENVNKPIVGAMATRLSSLQKSILPNGYGFLLMDQTGKVMIHNDNRLSMNENFLQESSNENEILSAITTRTVLAKSISYHNKKYRIYISPIDNMPFYLITYHDREYFRLPGVLIFYYTILFSMIGLLALSFWVIFLFIFNYRGSKLKYKTMILNWAIPNKKKGIWYWKATFVNVLAILIITFFVTVFGWTLTLRFLMVFIACNFIFPINYFLLKKCPALNEKKMTLSDIYHLVIKGKVTVVFLVILVLFNGILFAKGYHMHYIIILLAYQFFLLILLVFPLNVRISNALTKVYNKLSSYSISHAYTSFTVSWIILVSIIPALFYYQIVREKERSIWKNYDQLKLVQTLYQNKLVEPQGSADYSRIYLSHEFISTDQDILHKDSSSENRLINFFFYNLRLPIVELSELSKTVTSNLQLKKRDWSIAIKKGEEGDKGTMISYRYLGRMDTLRLSNPGTKVRGQIEALEGEYKAARRYKKVFSTIMILLLIALIYVLMYNLLKKVFGFDFLTLRNLIDTSRKQIDQSLQLGNDVFLIGLPSPDFYDIEKSIFKSGRASHEKVAGRSQKAFRNVERIDLQSYHPEVLSQLDVENLDLMILDHFEYAFHELEKLSEKLRLLEFLKAKSVQIIILSSVSPRQLELEYRRLSGKNIDPEKLNRYMHDGDLWSKLLTNFQVLHYRLQKYELPSRYDPVTGDSPLKVQLKRLIENELSPSTYFAALEPMVYQRYLTIVEKFDGPTLRQGVIEQLKDELIMYIQDMAHTYYHSLWSTCFKHQRYMLYDLAYDGIANFKDSATVLFLIKKGLLKIDNGLEIMNSSFRHFVVDVIGEEDAQAMKREMEQKGIWSSTKVVLIIVAISLLVFIFLVNKGSINQVSAIVTGAVALIGALLRLFSFGSGGSVTNTE